MDQVSQKYGNASTISTVSSKQRKFAPQFLAKTQYKDACNRHQSFVEACMEKANRSGGNCNDAFASWNACLAQDCGYTQGASEYACADDASSNSNTCGDGEQNEQCSAQQKEEISNTSNYTTTNDQNWKWDLDSKHECSVKRISLKSLLHKFKGGLPPLHHEPLLIYNDNDDYSVPSPLNGCVHSTFSEISSESNITKSLPPDFHVTLSSSNSFSAHRRTIPLKQYLNETVSTEISPHQLSNETWYLFGETYSKEWQTFLDSFCMPPCQTCTKEMSALAFGIGGRGSGVQWHTHGPGFSQSIHGRKHWVLFPPREKPLYNSDYASRHWMEETYMNMPPKQRPLECTLFPGEMIYFPDRWHHATINLDPYTAFVSTFTTEHGF